MNTRQLKTLYKKEIMDVVRDKKTIFTMVLLPVILYPLLFLIVMQVMTMILSNQETQTYYVAYSGVSEEDKTALETFIAGEEDGYDYVIETKQSENPQQDMQEEKIDAYITTSVMEDQIVYEIHYLSAVTDSANVSEMLEKEISALSQKTAERNAKEAGLNVTRMLHPVKAVMTDCSSNESSMGSLLGSFIPFLLITGIMTGCMYPAIDITAGEKERGTLETLLTLPVGNLEFIISKFLSVATVSIVSVFINVISIGGIVVYLYQTVMSLAKDMGSFRLSTFLPAIAISVVCIIAFALFMSAVVMCICAFAKSFKEANNYITPLTVVVMLTAYVGFIPSIELSAKTAMIPVANICLLMKNLMVFKYDFSLILIVLFSNMLYAFVAVWFLSRVYDSEAILFGESFSGMRLLECRKNIKKGSLPTIQESLFIWLVALLLMVYAGGMLSLSHPIAGVAIPQCVFGALPVLACLYMKGNVKKTFMLRIPKMRNLAGGVILMLGAGSISLLLSSVLSSWFPENSEGLNSEYMQMLDGLPFWAALLLIALLPAVCEELLFRGYMFSAFRGKMRLCNAMLLVSLLFAISHMSLIKVIPTAMLGVALAYGAYCSDSVITSALMHFLNNGFSVFVLYYGTEISLFQSETFSGLLLLGVAIVATPLGYAILKKGKQPES